MCPGTLALAATAASAASSVAGGISAGNAANYQAAVARNNALINARNAQYSASATSAATTQAGLRARAQNAQVKTAAAANGVDVTSGSPADVEVSQRELGALDVANVANRGAQQVYGYESQSVADKGQASLDASEASGDYLSGALKAVGDIAGSPSAISAGEGALGISPGTADIGNEGGGGEIPTITNGIGDIPPAASLISGPPSDLNSQYSWMSGGNSATPEELGLI